MTRFLKYSIRNRVAHVAALPILAAEMFSAIHGSKENYYKYCADFLPSSDAGNLCNAAALHGFAVAHGGNVASKDMGAAPAASISDFLRQ